MHRTRGGEYFQDSKVLQRIKLHTPQRLEVKVLPTTPNALFTAVATEPIPPTAAKAISPTTMAYSTKSWPLSCGIRSCILHQRANRFSTMSLLSIAVRSRSYQAKIRLDARSKGIA